mgnify:CR=1 FL=1
MFEVKDNKEIGAYIEKLIVDKFPNKRQFSIAYIEKVGLDRNNQEQIRKTSNKINQIIKGERATIQKHYGQGHKRQTTKRGLLTTNKG